MKKPKPSLDDLSPEQRDCLVAFAKREGSEWKTELGYLWMRGQDDPLLRQIRNQRGPVWLSGLPPIK